jgi:hypothetical protein
MKKRIFTNVFVILSLIILIWVLMKTGMIEKAFDAISESFNSNKNTSKELDDYPEYIYETFVDGNGDEISVKMEKKIGTLDGEEVVFYEDTIGAEVIYCNFYKGLINEINKNILVILIDKHFINVDLNASYYDYTDVDDYVKSFDSNEYNVSNLDEFGFKDMLSFNTEEIYSFDEINHLINKYVRIQDVLFKDLLTEVKYKSLNIFSK